MFAMLHMKKQTIYVFVTIKHSSWYYCGRWIYILSVTNLYYLIFSILSWQCVSLMLRVPSQFRQKVTMPNITCLFKPSSEDNIAWTFSSYHSGLELTFDYHSGSHNTCNLTIYDMKIIHCLASRQQQKDLYKTC